MNACPRCGERARKVAAFTVAGHISPTRLGNRADRLGWWLCSSRQCDVVYFDDDVTISRADVTALPFDKSDAPQRLVCFCFGHSVASVIADLGIHGTSTIRASIKAACRAGRDDCERRNPQGRCCLGNVGKVIAGAGASPDTGAEPGDHDCCDVPNDETGAPEDVSGRRCGGRPRHRGRSLV